MEIKAFSPPQLNERREEEKNNIQQVE